MGTIDLNDVAIFVTVVEVASFSRAASRLGLPKSSVSRAIVRLEEALGTRALHRTTRQVAPSTAGKALYDNVCAHVTALRRAVDELPEREEEPSGRVRVTAPVGLAGLLAEVTERLASRHSALEIEIRLTNAYVDLVAEGVDLALRFATKRLKDSTLNARKLGLSDIQVYAAPSYLARRGTPRAPRDLEEHPFIVNSLASTCRMEGGGPPVTVITRGRIVCDDFAFVRAAVVRGVGLGFLAAFQAEADVAAGRLVRVLPRWYCRVSNIWAIWPGARKPPRKVAAFLDVLVEALERHPLSVA